MCDSLVITDEGMSQNRMYPQSHVYLHCTEIRKIDPLTCVNPVSSQDKKYYPIRVGLARFPRLRWNWKQKRKSCIIKNKKDVRSIKKKMGLKKSYKSVIVANVMLSESSIKMLYYIVPHFGISLAKHHIRYSTQPLAHVLLHGWLFLIFGNSLIKGLLMRLIAIVVNNYIVLLSHNQLKSNI